MNFSRRGILGALFAAPVAAPVVAKQMINVKAERYVSEMPWNLASVPFSDRAGLLKPLGSPKIASAWGETERLRDNALRAYVMTTGKLPDWMVEDIEKDILRTSSHHNVEALKSVSGPAKMLIMNRRLRENRIAQEIDRIAFARSRHRALRQRIKDFWHSLGVPSGHDVDRDVGEDEVVR